MKYYAGIGSRETPIEVLELFRKVAKWLANKGYVLRSGGADGADMAFEQGCDLGQGKKEIFLPWKGFNKNGSKLFNVSNEAIELTGKYHPKWESLKDSVKKMMGRNYYQVMGENLKTPVDFIVCWTLKASGSGGTGQAIRIANDKKIKVFDFGSEKQKDEFREYCKLL